MLPTYSLSFKQLCFLTITGATYVSMLHKYKITNNKNYESNFNKRD